MFVKINSPFSLRISQKNKQLFLDTLLGETRKNIDQRDNCLIISFLQVLSDKPPHDSKDKMAKKSSKKIKQTALVAEKNEEAMIEGILEGSPDGIGVVVVRLDCGCRKMAAIAKDGEPASKVIMYRDQAESICPKCKEDNGDFMRVTESFIHWTKPEPTEAEKESISAKVLGTMPATH